MRLERPTTTNAPQICTPTPGFYRSVFHQTFNREIVRFFNGAL